MLTRNGLWTSASLALWLAACGGSGADCPEGTVKRGDVCEAENKGDNAETREPSTGSGGKTPGKSSMDGGAADTPTDDAGIDAEVPCAGPVYRDADGDGFGNPAMSSEDCSVVVGWVRDNTDCDDDNNKTYPDAGELCDSLDNDCDGQIDDNAAVPHWKDCDKDGYAPKDAPSMVLCREQPPPGSVCAWIEREPKDDNSTDCSDGTAARSPGKDEICDDVDNNCRDGADEGLRKIFYTDNDGDGFGLDETATIPLCDAPVSSSEKGGDCNDDPARGGGAIKPSAAEVCDYVDNNCNKQIDETLQTAKWYADCDRDGFVEGKKQERMGCPNAAPPIAPSCAALSGQWVNETALAKGNDCDDTRSDTYPGAPTEICDEGGHVEKCETLGQTVNANEALKVTYFLDCDGDNHVAPSAITARQCPSTARNPTTSCKQTSGTPTWRSAFASKNDCDDTRNDVNPGRAEECDAASVDNDCSGTDNEGKVVKIMDCDGDGYLSDSSPRTAPICPEVDPGTIDCTFGGRPPIGTPTWRVLTPSTPMGDWCQAWDNRVYPGQTQYFADPYDTGVGGSFDYNCDGKINDAGPGYHRGQLPLFYGACTSTDSDCQSTQFDCYTDYSGICGSTYNEWGTSAKVGNFCIRPNTTPKVYCR